MNDACLMPYLRLRRYLLLEQLDVSLATGIPVSRISRGERGRLTFNRVERSLLDDYFQMKLWAFGCYSGLIRPEEIPLTDRQILRLEASNA
jgi:hypothetical protein